MRFLPFLLVLALVLPAACRSERVETSNGAQAVAQSTGGECAACLCRQDEHVVAGVCQVCPNGETNEAGDPISGSDTTCDDRCFSALRVRCETFEEAYIKASNTGSNDQFGWFVAVDGDTLVVGAPQEDSRASGVDGEQSDNRSEDSGAVFVFVRSGDSWTQQAYIKASNPGAGDAFGASVALSGDTLVVGARREDSRARGVDGRQADNRAPDSGAVYVFVRNGSTWTQQAYIKASNTEREDRFGTSVALSEDTLLVGAPSEASSATGVDGDGRNNGTLESGAAYVFVRSGDTWTQQAYLKASNTGERDSFGMSVALSGDTAVVGAPWESSSATGIDGDQADNNGYTSGAAYAFVRRGNTWTQQAYIKASNTDQLDGFGGSLALDGDTLAVGAYREASAATSVDGDQTDNSSSYSGAVYVFVQSGATWSQQAYIKASNSGRDDAFGGSVALQGDTLVVGAPRRSERGHGHGGDQADNSASNSGAVYVFVRSDATWSQRAYIKSSNTDRDDGAATVALSGETLVIGAYEEGSSATGMDGDQADNDAPASGAVYVRRIGG